MIDQELLRALIRRTFTEWHQPARQVRGEGGRAVLEPVWLSGTEIYETIKRRATQLPGVGVDKINPLRRDEVIDALRSMREVRRRDANSVNEAFAWVVPGHP
jgi:hypothetical protein